MTAPAPSPAALRAAAASRLRDLALHLDAERSGIVDLLPAALGDEVGRWIGRALDALEDAAHALAEPGLALRGLGAESAPDTCPICEEEILPGEGEIRTVNLDPGDPEVGPRPQIEEVLVHRGGCRRRAACPVCGTHDDHHRSCSWVGP